MSAIGRGNLRCYCGKVRPYWSDYCKTHRAIENAPVRLARFVIARVSRGAELETYRPNLARAARDEARAHIAWMREDARRWGDSIIVRRLGGAK